MNIFSYFGGGGNAKRNNASKEAIVKLRQQLEMLRKREIHTEKQMLEQEAIARKNVTTNKTGRNDYCPSQTTRLLAAFCGNNDTGTNGV